MRAFLPREISPSEVDGPSARTCPFVTCSPASTIGLWLMQVPWLERLNFSSLKVCSLWVSSDSKVIVSAETAVITPSHGASTQTPESTAALYSIPVPTNGRSVLSSGTACLCMLEPINARFASSFSKNGIIEVATETTIFGETSIKSMRSCSTSRICSR